ncbi:RNA polymerase sigma factor [Mesorhizobium newzealandense]|uniref:RNA polymerase sigma factor n=1 Tax=Mesorhizobium newzealandense TaxID=1300302 RepID=A0ABW4U4I4_9HYPH
MTAVSADTARAAAEAAARQSYGKLVAWLAARTRDVAAAEDALADAFAAALERWPRNGVPEKPEAWLLAVARRRRVDAVRRRLTSEAGREHLKLIAQEMEARMTDEDLPDERLRLMFACAHPAIESSVRAPLILQTILGFDAATIASAFLVSPATMGQRLVRAKARIRETGIPFRVPERAELGERLDAVLEAIYAAFAEGWSDPAGTETQRRNLATEGIWLGRLVASLMPDEPEAFGLLALMLFAEARRPARRDVAGDYVPLAEQDCALWDDVLVDEAESLLRRAATMGVIGRYQLEAAVQSVHVARRLTGLTDWDAIRGFYDALSVIAGSPVVAINRAVAIAEAEGAAAGLAALYVLGDDKRLDDYQPYWAARAGLLARLGKIGKAVEAYDRAIGLERDPAVRRFLQGKRAALRN